MNTNKHKRISFSNTPRIVAAVLAVWLFVVLHAANHAHAGQTCEELPPSVTAIEKGLTLGAKTFDALEQSGAEVAVIARVGQDLGKYGLKHSHMGFVVRDHPQGKWTVVHMLNHCGKPDSALYAEGLGTFFMDTPFRYEAEITIPAPAVQTRLKTVLASDVPTRFKSARYNMLAYPFNLDSQNSNGWVLEVLNAGLATVPIDSRYSAMAYAKARGYTPTTLHIRAIERLGANVTRANISFDDHPFNRRMAGKIDTVTVISVVEYLKRNDHDAKSIDVVL